MHVNNVVEKKNPKHQRLCEKNCELQEKLEEKLDDGGKELLSQLIDCIVDEQIYNSQKKIYTRLFFRHVDGVRDIRRL